MPFCGAGSALHGLLEAELNKGKRSVWDASLALLVGNSREREYVPARRQAVVSNSVQKRLSF